MLIIVYSSVNIRLSNISMIGDLVWKFPDLCCGNSKISNVNFYLNSSVKCLLCHTCEDDSILKFCILFHFGNNLQRGKF